MVISFFKSDIGKLRENNEDALYASDEHLLFLLADGMGGHLGGEILVIWRLKSLHES